jgi:hypothetical protein
MSPPLSPAADLVALLCVWLLDADLAAQPRDSLLQLPRASPSGDKPRRHLVRAIPPTSALLSFLRHHRFLAGIKPEKNGTSSSNFAITKSGTWLRPSPPHNTDQRVLLLLVLAAAAVLLWREQNKLPARFGAKIGPLGPHPWLSWRQKQKAHSCSSRTFSFSFLSAPFLPT